MSSRALSHAAAAGGGEALTHLEHWLEAARVGLKRLVKLRIVPLERVRRCHVRLKRLTHLPGRESKPLPSATGEQKLSSTSTR